MKQSILYFLGRHKGKFIILFSLSSIYISIIFYLGYRIPQNDKNKDWTFFPVSRNLYWLLFGVRLQTTSWR